MALGAGIVKLSLATPCSRRGHVCQKRLAMSLRSRRNHCSVEFADADKHAQLDYLHCRPRAASDRLHVRPHRAPRAAAMMARRRGSGASARAAGTSVVRHAAIEQRIGTTTTFMRGHRLNLPPRAPLLVQGLHRSPHFAAAPMWPELHEEPTPVCSRSSATLR